MAGYTYPIESGPNAGDHLLFTAYSGRVAGYTKWRSRDGQPSQEVVGTVQLFLPENIKNTTKQNFQNTNNGTALSGMANIIEQGNADNPPEMSGVLKTLKGIIGGAGDVISASLGAGGESATLAAQSALGKGRTTAAANRHTLYQGPEYRSFSYAYNLMPKSEQESNVLTDIIEFFRMNMSPELSGNAGNFFTPPNYFELKYMIDGVESKHLNKIKPCVLTDFDVEFGGNGSFGMFVSSGASSVVNLSMTFQEVQLITRSDVKAGY